MSREEINNIITGVDSQTELFSCLKYVCETLLPRICVAKVERPITELVWNFPVFFPQRELGS
jgi:hypothetical protein